MPVMLLNPAWVANQLPTICFRHFWVGLAKESRGIDYHVTVFVSPMPTADFSRDLDQHRGYLLRVARLQLRDEAQAEDVVQETLLAALAGSGFSGNL